MKASESLQNDRLRELTIDRILPLSEVRRAHQLSQNGHARGKIVLQVMNGNGTLEGRHSCFAGPHLREFATDSRIFKAFARQKPRCVGPLPFAGLVAQRQRPSTALEAYESCPISKGGLSVAT
jgi:Zinc-binding dehydrogenase